MAITGMHALVYSKKDEATRKFFSDVLGFKSIDAGRGWLSPDDVTSAIQQKDRRKAGPTLPARGLCLEWVRYG